MPHDWQYFNNNLFLADFEKINRNHVLQLNQNNVKGTLMPISSSSYENNMSKILH